MDLLMKRIRIIGSQQNGPNTSTKHWTSWQGKSENNRRNVSSGRASKAYQRVVDGKARFRHLDDVTTRSPPLRFTPLRINGRG